ncbi:hypothetical protein DL771_007591 [Monosporascus sp. 5C6A]|nr:hypothetical protein DL771_007591 [Monosporascus sp. 5C6A]
MGPRGYRAAVAAIPVKIVFDASAEPWRSVGWTKQKRRSAAAASSSKYSISNGSRMDFGTGDKHCLTQRLCFPFLSSEGPLVWTVWKGHRRMVLLDAHDRIVAYGDRLMCAISDDAATATVPSCRWKLLVAEILVTYVALRVQMQRLKEWKTAENNERAYTAQ